MALRRTLPVLAALAFVAGSVLVPAAAHAADPVTNGDDAGIGSLRYAVSTAVAGDTIVIPATVTSIELESPITVGHGITIQGPGSDILTISRADASVTSIFRLPPITANYDYVFAGMALTANTASGDFSGANGPAIQVELGANLDFPRDITLRDIEAYDNIATTGAVITAHLIRNLSIYDSHFYDNSVTLYGGAVDFYDNDGALTISGSRFEDNTADDFAGAVYAGLSTDVTVTDSVFLRNQANGNDPGDVGRGGGLYVESIGNLTLTGTTFDGNFAATQGGGVYSSNSSTGGIEITSSVLVDNEADEGGGIYVLGSLGPVEITGSTFDRNEATGIVGGGAYLGALYDSLSIFTSSFVGNVSGGQAAGFYLGLIEETEDLFAEIQDSTFARNVAENGQGISFVFGNSDLPLYVINSTFSEHAENPEFSNMVNLSSVTTGAFFAHSTFSGPTPIDVSSNASTVDVTHSIFDSPEPLSSSESDINAEWSIFSLSAAAETDVTGTTGNLFSTSPELAPLADNGGPTETHFPLVNSPAIDKGDPSVFGQPVFDQRGLGFDRVVHTIIDIGAVEVAYPYPGNPSDPSGGPALAATGSTLSPVAPIGAAIALLLGLGAVAAVRLKAARRSS